MKTNGQLQCNHCGRADFKTKHGLKQHQLNSKSCQGAAREALANLQANRALTTQQNPEHRVASLMQDGQHRRQMCNNPLPPVNDPPPPSDKDDDEDLDNIVMELDDDDPTQPEDPVAIGANDPDPIDQPLAKFRQYVADAHKNFGEFSTVQAKSIQLLHILRRKGASLDTYDEVMKWHLKATKDNDPSHFISRAKMFKTLRKRYNLEDYQRMTTITLPSSKAKVNLMWHDARENVVSLLTDPRFNDDDFLHFDDDPLAPPPDDLNYLADINTGKSYKETYNKLVTKPGKQMPVGIILYQDSAVTGQFDKLPHEAVKMSLGIFTNSARKREHAWRVLGRFCCCTISSFHCFGNILCSNQNIFPKPTPS